MSFYSHLKGLHLKYFGLLGYIELSTALGYACWPFGDRSLLSHFLDINLCCRICGPCNGNLWPLKPELLQVVPGHASGKHVLDLFAGRDGNPATYLKLVCASEVLLTWTKNLFGPCILVIIVDLVVLLSFPVLGRVGQFVFWIDCLFPSQSIVESLLRKGVLCIAFPL